MRTDSFEIFREYKTKINNGLDEFNLLVESRPSDQRIYFHPLSTNNLAKGISKFNNREANKLKDLILNYINEVTLTEFSESRYENKKISLDLYNKYLMPAASYLIHEDDFGLEDSLKLNIILGVIFDFFAYKYLFNYLYPIFTFIFITAIFPKYPF